MIQVWHEKTPKDIAADFKVDLSVGLTPIEAEHRLQSGKNLLVKQKKTSPLIIFIRQLNSLVIWVLLGSAGISFLLGEKVNAIAIFAIVILNAVIGFVLEYRADRAILALQQMAAPKTTVFRDGHAKSVSTSDIVPGDIILFESGDLIAADARLFDLSSLKINEAPLTGESLAIEKNLSSCDAETPLADRKNMVFMGTSVANGTGRAIVVATGMDTEMGHIAAMLGAASHDETPLQKKLNQVSAYLLSICFVVVILIFLLGLFRNIPIFKLFMSSISLAVAAIPEGLTAVVTVALALSVQRMVRRAVLVRRLSAVETMGCLQIICTDKTGTLTVGEMTARKLITAESIYNIVGEGYNLTGYFTWQNQEINSAEDTVLQKTMRAVVACNNADITLKNNQLSVVGDPTEIALLVAAAKGGFWRDEVESSFPRLKELPFNSERKRMTVVCRELEQLHVFVKGAPEIILERCTHILTRDGIKEITPDDHSRIQQSCQLMASEALRLLAFAERPFDLSLMENTDEVIENNLVWLGLIGLQDPPHADVKASVSQCKMAGIKPVMITGDHPDTARAIAGELGILNPGDRLITGRELDRMSDEEFINSVKEITVYARVTAEHKLKIVRAWKQNQMIVAMTGDGVNDAPALKEASVGIAMGKTGTAVTKEAADVIIIDNSFTSIVAGIEEGRTIYDNISKTLAYLLAGNASELMIVFAALLIGWPLPLLPVQLLWINLVTDGLPGIAMATEMTEPGTLNRPPRDPKKPFMDAFFLSRVAFIGLLTSVVVLSVFGYEYLVNGDLIQAQDAAFSVLVTANLLRAFGARSRTKTIWQLGFFSNIRLFFVVSISFSLQLLIHHVPMLQKIFGIEAVSLKQCLLWVLLGTIPLLVLEVQKLLRKTSHEVV
ncbi:TPA: HAD-IC family P-type ATPase [Legionella pneumophila]|nr:HAD-IC family P-type ATPase [Legionella pneumophila]HAT8583790.1 HAD-IC family P-type ATPase [Legionella pneumophila]